MACSSWALNEVSFLQSQHAKFIGQIAVSISLSFVPKSVMSKKLLVVKVCFTVFFEGDGFLLVFKMGPRGGSFVVIMLRTGSES
jgi:hypothetical protein